MIRHWSFFDPKTGEFSPQRFSAPDGRDLARNTPDGLEAIEGVFDHLTQRVENGAVVEFDNNKASDLKSRREAATYARARIAALETRQLRLMREDRLRPDERDPADNKTAREKLQSLDDEIASLREIINAGMDTSAPSGRQS